MAKIIWNYIIKIFYILRLFSFDSIVAAIYCYQSLIDKKFVITFWIY